MKRNLLLLLTSLLALVWIDGFATGQVPDRLFYKGDTLFIFTNPLEQLYDDDSLRPKFFGDKAGCITTACWRGYVAEWAIKDNRLYLTSIRSCCFYEDSVQADLKRLFGDKVMGGVVSADWFSGNILAPQGKLLYYVHMGYESLYEKELEFQFEKGHCIGIKTYDNSKSKQSVYSQNPIKLQEFVYSNIRWANLPELGDQEIRVFLRFLANENGVIDSVIVLKGSSPVYNEEAIHAVKTIPEWDVFYRHGKFERKGYTMPIFFSNANREKYDKRRKKP